MSHVHALNWKFDTGKIVHCIISQVISYAKMSLRHHTHTCTHQGVFDVLGVGDRDVINALVQGIVKWAGHKKSP
jgi:hypothetical protein